MVRIQFTNIIVDEFSTATYTPHNKYIHFLTHIHADHIKGLTNSWDYGPIYCSKETKNLIRLKFPDLKCLKELQLDIQHRIELSPELEITVTLFDSNHCGGGTMMFLEGFMGNIVYTGDMRFDREIFQEYSYLYPHNKRNKNFSDCSKHVDYLYLDITFLHPKFTFPSKKQAQNILEGFIEKQIRKSKEQKKMIEFYIGMDTFGKEEILLSLAEKFETFVVVSEQRFKNISVMGLDTEIFSTDPSRGFIHVVLKRDLQKIVAENENRVGIILTGWANTPHWRKENRIYAIPYSLHSSYPEIRQFVDSIRPSYIQSIIDTPTVPSSKNDQGSTNQMYEAINYDDYLDELRTDFCKAPTEELLELMTNHTLQRKLHEKLRLDTSPKSLFNKEEHQINNLRVKNIENAGARIKTVRDEEEIERVKASVKMKKAEFLKSQLAVTRNKSKGSTGLMNRLVPDQSLIQGGQSCHLSQKVDSVDSSSESIKRRTTEESFSRIDISGENDGEESSLSRKQRWKKMIEEGEIDLFKQPRMSEQHRNINTSVGNWNHSQTKVCGQSHSKTTEKSSSSEGDLNRVPQVFTIEDDSQQLPPVDRNNEQQLEQDQNQEAMKNLKVSQQTEQQQEESEISMYTRPGKPKPKVIPIRYPKKKKPQKQALLIPPRNPYEHLLDPSESTEKKSISTNQMELESPSMSNQKTLRDYKWFNKKSNELEPQQTMPLAEVNQRKPHELEIQQSMPLAGENLQKPTEEPRERMEIEQQPIDKQTEEPTDFNRREIQHLIEKISQEISDKKIDEAEEVSQGEKGLQSEENAPSQQAEIQQTERGQKQWKETQPRVKLISHSQVSLNEIDFSSIEDNREVCGPEHFWKFFVNFEVKGQHNNLGFKKEVQETL